jgi:hypothetical protein
MNIKIEHQGKIVEIQIIPRPIAIVNDASHGLYEDIRILKNISNPEEIIIDEINRLEKKVKILNESAWNSFTQQS